MVPSKEEGGRGRGQATHNYLSHLDIKLGCSLAEACPRGGGGGVGGQTQASPDQTDVQNQTAFSRELPGFPLKWPQSHHLLTFLSLESGAWACILCPRKARDSSFLGGEWEQGNERS